MKIYIEGPFLLIGCFTSYFILSVAVLPHSPRVVRRETIIPGVAPETLYHRDDALLYIAYVMLIWAAPIPADRWHCSLWP